MDLLELLAAPEAAGRLLFAVLWPTGAARVSLEPFQKFVWYLLDVVRTPQGDFSTFLVSFQMLFEFFQGILLRQEAQATPELQNNDAPVS